MLKSPRTITSSTVTDTGHPSTIFHPTDPGTQKVSMWIIFKSYHVLITGCWNHKLLRSFWANLTIV